MLELYGTDDEAAQPTTDDVPVSETFSSEPPSLKVLLIADEVENSMLIERCLREMSAYEPQITIAGSLGAARFAASVDEFDVLLIDDDFQGVGETNIYAMFGLEQDACPTVLLTSSESLSPGSAITSSTLSTFSTLRKAELSPALLQATINRAIGAHAQQCTMLALVSAA